PRGARVTARRTRARRTPEKTCGHVSASGHRQGSDLKRRDAESHQGPLGTAWHGPCSPDVDLAAKHRSPPISGRAHATETLTMHSTPPATAGATAASSGLNLVERSKQVMLDLGASPI